MDIGQRIRHRREELNMSQKELARLVGYTSRTTVNKIENGANNLRQNKIVAFAAALDCTPAYLMGWEEEPALIDIDTNTFLKAIDKLVPDDAVKEWYQYAEMLVDLNLDKDEMKKVAEYAKFIKSQRSDE